MVFNFSKKYLYVLIIGLLAIILLIAVFSGVNKGKTLAQSRLTEGNAVALAKGLEFFYSDHEQFPTAIEFSNQELMRRYYNMFPPTEFASAICQQTFSYKRLSAGRYQLSFCLPTAVGEHRQGWNTLSN